MFVVICLLILVGAIALVVYLSNISAKASANAKNITENLISENGLDVTTKIGTFMIDENKKKWFIHGVNYLFEYGDIIDFKYSETGGQIANASVASKTLYGTAITSQISGMSVVIHTKVQQYPALYVHLISNTVVKTDSMLYRLSKSNAETLIAKLTQITADNTNNISTAANNNSAADEIAKYKSLLDSGAITQDEYDKKKKELLSI